MTRGPSPSQQAVAVRPINPDGKGTHGFLLDWQKSDPRGVTAKSRRQLLAEYFTSMLVLSARFQYRPTVGMPNFLYLVDDDWDLSLIAPHEWSDERRAGFVAKIGEDHMWHSISQGVRQARLHYGLKDGVADVDLGRAAELVGERLDPIPTS